MAIKLRNKRKEDFSTASMSDLVFLLLIFFMLTSTMIAPNAVKLLLPQSDSKPPLVEKAKVTVYVNESLQYSIDDAIPVAEEMIYPILAQKLAGQTDASVTLRCDFTVPIQNVVAVIDAVNRVNDADPTRNTKNKVILATTPKN